MEEEPRSNIAPSILLGDICSSVSKSARSEKRPKSGMILPGLKIHAYVYYDYFILLCLGSTEKHTIFIWFKK